MGNDKFSKEGLESYGENSPFEKGGQTGDLSLTSAAATVWTF